MSGASGGATAGPGPEGAPGAEGAAPGAGGAAPGAEGAAPGAEPALWWNPWAVLAVGALLPLARVLGDPLHVVTGTRLSDMYKHVWSYWHVLAIPWRDWPHTPYLNAPGGGVLMDLLFLPAMLLAPVTAALGPAASANLWVWLNIWGTGAATFALARALAGGSWAPLVAGLAAQTAPYMLGYPLASGVHERLMVWVFPLVVLAILRCKEGAPRARWVALATVGFFVAGLGCQAYALYGVVMLLLGLPVWLGGDVGANVRRLLPLAAGLFVAGAAAWGHTNWLTEDAWALVPRPGETYPVFGPAQPGEGAMAVARFESLFDPLAVRATQVRVSGDELHEFVYLGWVPLLAALGGALLARGPRRWVVRGLAALGFGMAVLAMGPTFFAGGIRFVEPLSIAVSWVVPFHGRYAPQWQQAAIFTPLIAPAVATLLGRLPRPGIASVILFAAILAERAWVMPVSLAVPATRLEIPTPYLSIGEGPVVDIPRVIGRTPLAPGLYFLAQTWHQQPMAASINPGNSVWDQYAPVLRGVSSDWSAAADCLRRGGLRWVVVHRDWMDDPTVAARAVAGLEAAAGAAVADDGNVVLFDLGPARSDPPRLPPPTVQAYQLGQRGWIGHPAVSLLGPRLGADCPID